jgi:hypothetical protein
MALNNNDQARIREYLLGRLSDEEEEKIEERLMVDDEFFEELEISKGEILDEYSAGELSQTDRKSFEEGYLASPEGRKRFTFSVALDRLGQRKPAPAPAPMPRVAFFDRMRAFFNWQRLAFAAGSAALVLTVATTLIFRRPPVFISVDLTSNVANRSPGARQYHRLTVPSNADEVRFSLQLPQSATPRSGYVVELDNQTDVTTFTPLSQSGNSVLVAIPANQLPPGIYSLRLQARLADGTSQPEPWEYYFQVVK